MKKVLAYWVEVLLIAGLLWAGQYALAAVALYLVIPLLMLRRRVDYLCPWSACSG
jgi:hypothetical protein